MSMIREILLTLYDRTKCILDERENRLSQKKR